MKISRFLLATFTLTFMANALGQIPQTLVPIESNIRQAFQSVSADARVQQALLQLETNEAGTVEEQIRMTEIPAPPFLEQRRAEYYLQRLQERGLENVIIDDEGNAIGIRRGLGDGPTLLVAAHLDTVFPATVDTTVRNVDGRYYAPGIGDDTRGLAVLLAVLDVLNESGIQTVGDILIAGNVGEEGRGDLRGVKAIFRNHPEIDGFISIDGVKLRRITVAGTGSRRFEFRFNGPGGHSYGDFGLASAIHAMGRAIANIAELKTPSIPKTTFTVGTVDGGTSVNSIAADAVFALDMRSTDPEQLILLEQQTKQAALDAVAAENARWNNGEITVDFNLIGDRPVGRTAADSPIVQAAALAFDEAGVVLEELSTSSTDSNVPMALGIPAITIAGGGDGGGSHSPDEWFEPIDSHLGPQTALLTILALVGIEGVSPPLLNAKEIGL